MPDARARELRRLALDIPTAVAELPRPSYVVDLSGTVQWLNAAAERVFGDRRGEHFLSAVAPEAQDLVREQFTRKIEGASRATSYYAVVLDANGNRLYVDVDSVAVGADDTGGKAVAVFGFLDIEDELEGSGAGIGLTPRQLQVLRLLARGRSTDEIATQLHLSRETVRNHVRHVLRALDTHSRLEAVARARDLGIV